MKILFITLFLAIAVPLSVLVALQIQDIRQNAAVNIIGSNYPYPGGPGTPYNANYYGWNGTCYTNINTAGSAYQNCTVNLWKCPGLTSFPPGGCQQNVQPGVKCFDANFCGVQQIDVDCPNVFNFCSTPPNTQEQCTSRLSYDSFRSTVRTMPDCGVSNPPTPTPSPVPTPTAAPTPTPPPTCPSDINAQFRINYNPPCPVTGGNSNCDKGWNTNHNATLGNLPSVGVEVLQFNIFNNTGQSRTDGSWVLRDRFGNAVLSGRHTSSFDPRNVSVPYVTGGPYRIEFTSDATGNVCGTGEITLDPPPPTPTPVPTPSPTPTPSPFAQCQNIKVYRVGTIGDASSWTLLNSTQLPNLLPGETIYIATVGSVANGVIDKARIRVNSNVWTAVNETTQMKPKAILTDPDEYYVAYTVPAGIISFSFQSELHERNGNRWY